MIRKTASILSVFGLHRFLVYGGAFAQYPYTCIQVLSSYLSRQILCYFSTGNKLKRLPISYPHTFLISGQAPDAATLLITEVSDRA